MNEVSVGDIEILRYTVDPATDDTVVTLVVTDPDGTTTTPAVASESDPEDTVQVWASDPVSFDTAGRWVLTWTIDNGDDQNQVVDEVVQVVDTPLAGGPTWTPGRDRVANYVPGRTLPRDSETLQRTFYSSTTPDGVQVDRLIFDAVGWVLLRTGEVNQTLHDQASTCAAIWAASNVELGYPDSPDDDNNRRTAQDLRGMAERMREDLKRANDAIVGTNPNDPAAVVMPRYNFPVPGVDVLDWRDSYV